MTALALCVGLAGVATAHEPIPGARCSLKWEDFAEVWGTGTPLDGTQIDRPYLVCYY